MRCANAPLHTCSRGRRPAVGLRRQPPEARFGFMPRAWRNRSPRPRRAPEYAPTPSSHDRRRAHYDLAGSADGDFVEIIIDYSYFGEVHRRVRVQARLAHRALAPFSVERVAARAGDLRHAIAFDNMRHTE